MAETVKVIYDLVDEMSGDLKQINAQLEKFGKNTKKNGKSVDGIDKSIKSMGKAVMGSVAAMGAMKALRFGNELATIGREASLVNKNFEQFAKNSGKQAESMMQDLRAASMGFVDDMALQQSAIQAMASGVSFDDLATSMEFVSKFALATGKNVTDLMRTTMTGLSRESALFLDDIGIMVQGADDVVGAAIDQMKAKMGQFADTSETAAAKSKRFEAEISSLKQEIGQGLVPAQANMLSIQKDFFQEIADNEQVMKVFAEGIGNITKYASDLAIEWGHIISGLTGADIQAAVETQSQSVKTLQMAADLAREIQTETLKGENTAELKKRLAFMMGAQGDYNKLVGTFGVEANQKYAKTEKELAKAISERAAARAMQVDKEETDKMLADAAAREATARKEAEAEAKALNIVVEAERKAGAARGAQMEKDISKRTEIRKKAEAEALQSLQNEMTAEAEAVWNFKQEKREKDKEDRAQDLDDRRAHLEAVFSLTESYANSTSQIIDAAFQSKINNIDAEKRAEIDAVRVSTMSQKKKSEEIAKIQKKAQKESLALRQKIWGTNLVTAGTNTSLAVTAALADPTPMPTVLRAAQATGIGLKGLAEVATIAANKPKFAGGGAFDGVGIVSGTSMVGDNGNARINAGEAVMNQAQQRQLFDLANGNTETTNNNQKTYQITVSALDPVGAASAVSEALAIASENNMVDTTRLNVSA